MNRVKRGVLTLAIVLGTALSLAGCKKDVTVETEGDAAVVTETPTEKETVAEKIGTTTTSKKYTSKDKTMSIMLPDTTWTNTKDANNTLVFEAEGKGSITVNHISGANISADSLPSSKEEVLNNLKETGKDTSYYEVVEFEKQKVGDADEYHTVVKCTDTAEKYVYTVGFDIVSGSDIYSVTGLVEADDDVLLKQVQDAVESFTIIKKSSSKKKNEKESETNDSDSSQNAVDSMVIYDSNGNPIYVNKDASGVWKDSSGKTYDMQQYGVMGSDGYWYTYEAPPSGSSGDSSSTSNGSSGNSGDTRGFYDTNGNYVETRKDANGNWVDEYGTVYEYGNDGVTDDSGNTNPYKTEGETNGFLDSDGNYVVTTKDSNGNWVDSAGTVYYYGDDGVTDSSGNFYPY